MSKFVIIGTAHRSTEPGKCSPDGRLKECVYSREIALKVCAELNKMGIRAIVDYEPLELPKQMRNTDVQKERNNELKMRVDVVNYYCEQFGAKNVVYVSIHNNASSADGEWHKAEGWQVHVSTRASMSSKRMADCLFDAALKQGMKTRQRMPSQKYWPQDLYVLNHTKCPAVLTENLFQDNKEDVAFLLSDEGKEKIVRLHVNGIVDYLDD